MKISIITPSYNQAQFIRKTLDSVLCRQNYDNIEHIVIDGCSSDGTLEILKAYKDKYPNKLFYIYEKDSGQSNAINKGFKKATGEIIGWINSDDYYEDNIFHLVLDFFKNNPDVDMIYSGGNIVDENGKYIHICEEAYGFKKLKIKNYKDFNYNTLLNVHSGLIPQPTVFFRNKIFKEVGYLDETYNFTMDYEYWLRIGKKCNIKRIDLLLANLRMHKDAKTSLFKYRFIYMKEALSVRKKYGGKLIAPINLFFGFIAFKTFIKSIMIKLRILENN